MPFDFIAFFGYFHTLLTIVFMSKVLYLHQTFADCISNEYWYVKIPYVPASYGMSLKFITFFAYFAQKWWIFISEMLYLRQTLINCVFVVNTNISLW